MLLIEPDTSLMWWAIVLSQTPNFLLLPLKPVAFQVTVSDSAASSVSWKVRQGETCPCL